MSQNAYRLVKKLAEMDIVIRGASFHILHHKGQERMNKLAGEAAPTWELRVNPLRHTITGRIVVNGKKPNINLPGGDLVHKEVYGYQPLTHILKTTLDKWDVDVDELNRLLVSTFVLPDSWQ